jgi:hypothetical protein
MARNLVTAYSVGTRTITINDPNFDGFTIENISLIINETQKKVYASSMQKALVKSIVGDVITIADAFPNIGVNDKITVAMDMGFVGADAVASEINAGKSIISQSLNIKGQISSPTDSFNTMANQIQAVTGDVTVNPVNLIPSYWHNPADIWASNTNPTFTHGYLILLSKGQTSVELLGGERYVMSDGTAQPTGGTYTFDTSKDNEGVDTKASFTGVINAGTEVTIQATKFGAVGNILLVADEVKTVNQLIAEYNATASYNYLVLTDGDGEQVPINDVQLTGGVLGNVGKVTRWVIALTSASNYAPTANFTAASSPAYGLRNILAFFTYDLNPVNITLTNYRIPFVVFNEFTGEYKEFNFAANAFASNLSISYLALPSGIKTTGQADNVLILNNVNLFYPGGTGTHSSLTTLIFPEGLVSLTLSGASSFQNCSGLTSIVFPSTLKTLVLSGNNVFTNIGITSLSFPQGLLNLNITGASVFTNNTALAYMYISKPSVDFPALHTGLFTGSTALVKIELEALWNWTINLQSASVLTAENTKDFILDKLVDKRGDGTNATTITVDTASPNVVAVNGNFTNVFRPNQTITPAGGTVRTILSITDDNNLVLTANAGVTGTGLAYDMNKTLTLASAVNTRLITAYGADWADTYTAKGWTITIV